MESFVALGLACNVLQLIGHGLRVIQTAKELRDRGSTAWHEQTAHQSAQMMQISQEIDTRLSRLSQATQLTTTQLELKTVALSCQTIAARLHHETARSQHGQQKQGWRKAIPGAIKMTFRKSSVNDLKEQLQQHHRLLQTRLLADLHVQQEATALQQSHNFGQLDKCLQRLVIGLAHRDASLSVVLDAVSVDISQTVKLEGSHTRQAVESTIDQARLREELRQEREQLLESLRFDRINERMNSVPDSHTNTLNWIFDRSARKRWDDFVDWLESGDSIYWVSGKPASGKSVLMKFIATHERTQDHLSVWSNGSLPYTFSFYIWKGGNELQRKEHGLLCSLLHQALRESESFMSSTLENSRHSSKREAADWSNRELRRLVSQFSHSQNSKTCIFIDGLDESDPTDGDVGMIQLVHWLQALPNTKLCVSSRAEPELRAAFTALPHITLEQLNRENMRKYVNDRLLAVGRRATFQHGDPHTVPFRLTDLVLRKADGVFLWVRLAVSTVSRGLHRLDGWEDLTRRLESLPTELEMLYVDMLQRNEDDLKHYHTEAKSYFQLALATQDDPLSCFDMTVSKSNSAQALLECRDSEIAPVALLQDCKRLEQRVLTCCMGLLEWRVAELVSESARPVIDLREPDADGEISAELSEFRRKHIHFLHRTVIDFLTDPGASHDYRMQREDLSTIAQKMRIDASLVAPYYEFPIIDFNDLLKSLNCITDGERATPGQLRYARVLENIQSRLKTIGLLPQSSDMYRHYVHNLGSGTWEIRFPARLTIVPFDPIKYAIGWVGLAADAAFLPYFQSILGHTKGSRVNAQYLSCVAYCASRHMKHLFIKKEVKGEIQQLRFLNMVADMKADLRVRFASAWGLSYHSDAWFELLNHGLLVGSCSKGDVTLLLHELQLLLKHNVDPGATHVQVFYRSMTSAPGGESFPFFHTRLDSLYQDRRHRSSTRTTFCEVELNFAAQLSMYLMSMTGSAEQTTEIVKPFGRPSFTLLCLAYLDELNSASVRVRQPSNMEDSKSFYDAQLRRIKLRSREADDFMFSSPVWAKVMLEVEEVVKDIYDRGTDMTETDAQKHHDYLLSKGHITPYPVRYEDIPFLQPFDTEEKDCSKFMLPP